MSDIATSVHGGRPLSCRCESEMHPLLRCAGTGRASPGQTGIAARRVSSANTPGNRLSHLVSSSDSRVSTHSVHEGLCIFAALERTEGSTGANLQRHVFRSRALMTCTLARPQRRARFVLSETFYVPHGQDSCHLVRQLQHEQLQNHSYSVLYNKHQRACRLRHDVKSSTHCSYRSLCSAG